MKDTNLIVRMNLKTKEEAMSVAASYGLSLSALVNSYLTSVAYSGKIPSRELERARQVQRKGTLSLSSLKKAVVRLASRYSKEQIEAVYLFGSYARKEARKDSDIDFLIVPGSRMDYFLLGSLNYQLQEKIGQPVDTVLETGLSSEIRERVKKERILLYSADSKKDPRI